MYSHWNYRVIKDEDGFSIREVYYKDEAPEAWSARPMYPCGETSEELNADLDRMREAFNKPILVEKNELISDWDGS